ncbi:60S acidic ribosomal protein P1 [Emmonsiellopsis sp. PD_5]|nr:60S acidic ribosomal protein P1 [Emmonsiellopsis sp. PD_5]
MSQAELAVSYAALILADDGVDVTSEKLQSLLKAANVQDVEPIWSSLFAKALEGKDVKDLLLNVGSGGAAAPAAAGGAVAAEAGAAAEEKKEEKEEEKEESDEDMGFGLFD